MLVFVPDGVDVDVAVGDRERVLESESVADGLTPRVKLDVGVPEFDLAALAEEVGEDDDVGVPVVDAVGLGVTLNDKVLVIEGVAEKLDVIEALAPIEMEAVGVTLAEAQSESTLVIVGDGVNVEDGVLLLVDVEVEVGLCVGFVDVETVEVFDEEKEIVGEILAVPPKLSVDEDDSDGDGVPVPLDVLLSVQVDDNESVVELVEVPLLELVGVGVFELVLVNVSGAEFVLVEVIEGVPSVEGETLDDAPNESVGVAEKVVVEVALAVLVIELDCDVVTVDV